MRRLVILHLIVISVGCLIPASALKVAHADSIVIGGGISVVGATSAELAMLTEVSQKFERVDLHLSPDLQVEFSPEPADCGEYDGTYVYKRDKVTFCRPSDKKWKALKRLAIHELGHAWDDHNMTDANRRHYTAKIGKSGGWLDERLAHDDRPGERFAGTVTALVQGMIDRERFDAMIGLR